MDITGGSPTYSATDLVAFLEWDHLTSLELASASGHLESPVRTDPVLDRIVKRGELHEEGFLESLRSEGLKIEEIQERCDLPRAERIAKGKR